MLSPMKTSYKEKLLYVCGIKSSYQNLNCLLAKDKIFANGTLFSINSLTIDDVTY